MIDKNESKYELSDNDAEWAWSYPGSERADGPFCSRDAAIAAAHEAGATRIALGRVSRPVAGLYAARVASRNIPSLLEAMDEQAGDDGFYAEDENFDINGDRKQAEQELSDLMTAWADRWISPSAWTFNEQEQIDITKEGQR